MRLEKVTVMMNIQTVSKPQERQSADYRRRVMGCWLGKAVGATLGMPYEGNDGPLGLTFYNPVPTTMLSNDDLELQIAWACVLDRLGDNPVVDRHILGQA